MQQPLPPRPRLSDHFDADERTLLTTMPEEAFYSKLQFINDRHLRELILDAVSRLYYVETQRNASSIPEETYFTHIAGTALYEGMYDIRMRGFDHVHKANDLRLYLFGFCRDLETKISRARNPEEQTALEEVKKYLEAHIAVLNKALDYAPADRVQLPTSRRNPNKSAPGVQTTPKKRRATQGAHPVAPNVTPKRTWGQIYKAKRLLQRVASGALALDQIQPKALFGRVVAADAGEASNASFTASPIATTPSGVDAHLSTPQPSQAARILSFSSPFALPDAFSLPNAFALLAVDGSDDDSDMGIEKGSVENTPTFPVTHTLAKAAAVTPARNNAATTATTEGDLDSAAPVAVSVSLK